MTDLNAHHCDDCPVRDLGTLTRLGISMKDTDFVVALAGNPNTGKSTVFNALTGLRQHTGNWPGKTVTRAEGAFEYGAKRFKLVDLPGTYSLLSNSTDEEVARDFILFAQPDVTVIVVDATRLERNLNLVLQVLEITDRAVLCLNLMDEAKRNGVAVDERRLAKRLGIPVIPTAARQEEGIPELLKAVYEVAVGSYVCRPYRLEKTSPKLERSVAELTARIDQAFPGLPNARWIALRLLEGDQRIIDSIRSGDMKNLVRSAPQRRTADA